jgi:nicotinate dehydrogenase subunit B
LANRPHSDSAPRQLDDWIVVEPDGRLTIFSGKVELGTGVSTALAQIAAEELDVPLEAIRLVMGDTGRTPDEGHTTGSKTLQIAGAALRHAAAEARLALIEMAADHLDSEPKELIVQAGVISVRHDPARAVTYTELMGGGRFNRPITGTAPLKQPENYKIVGQSAPRVDLPRKFTGQPSFVQDLRLPGMWHGRVVRPPSPGATILALDENSAPEAQVVRLGNFIGVVAEREEQAIHAAEQLTVTWQETAPLPPMASLFDDLHRQTTNDEVVAERGEIEIALQRSRTRLEATYTHPYQAHASLGPSCAVADFRGDQLTVWCSSQGVYALRGALADLLKLPPEQVRVIHVEGAGCYGHNGFDDATADAALLARAVRRPVRVQWSRADEFIWEPKAPAMVMELRGGLDAQGNVMAWDDHVWSPSHTTRPRSGLELLAGQLMSGQSPPSPRYFGGGDRNAPTNYAFPASRVTMHWLARSPLRSSAMRGLGAAPNTFANESFMDELAAAAQVDPLEFRLRYISDPRAIEVLWAAAQAAGWGAALPADEGRGLAFAQYENHGAYVATVAHVQVDRSSGAVRVRRLVVAHDCGLIINPDGLRNQIEGNTLQALSRALKEEVTFDAARITSVDWESYPILKFSEVPDVEIILLNRPDQPALGGGEPATVTPAAAVANAVFAAVGVRVRALPITPEKVRRAVIGVA